MIYFPVKFFHLSKNNIRDYIFTFYIQANVEDVQIKAESDITKVGAGYGNVEIAGLGDLVVYTTPISRQTDGIGNNSSYLSSYKLQ